MIAFNNPRCHLDNAHFSRRRPLQDGTIERSRIKLLVIEQYEDFLDSLLRAIIKLLKIPSRTEKLYRPDVIEFLTVCRDWGGLHTLAQEASAGIARHSQRGSILDERRFIKSSSDPQKDDPHDMSLIRVATMMYGEMSELRHSLLTEEAQPLQASAPFLHAPSVAADSPQSLINDIQSSPLLPFHTPSFASLSPSIPDELDGASVECQHWHHFLTKPGITSCSEKPILPMITKISICATELENPEDLQLGRIGRLWYKLFVDKPVRHNN